MSYLESGTQLMLKKNVYECMKTQLKLHKSSCVVGNIITDENIWLTCISISVDN